MHVNFKKGKSVVEMWCVCMCVCVGKGRDFLTQFVTSSLVDLTEK